MHRSKRKSEDIYPVRTKSFYGAVIAACDKREDKWGDEVRQRIVATPDLIAAEAIYHKPCDTNFRTLRLMPQQYGTGLVQTKKKARFSGRPADEIKMTAFLKVTQYIEENDDEQSTVSDLVDKMDEFIKDTDCACGIESYSAKYMKRRLLEHFGNRIFISTKEGRADVITFVTKASTILSEFHDNQSKGDSDAEKINKMIVTVGKLIKHDIRQQEVDNSCYPLAENLSDIDEALGFVPDSLRLLLKTVMCGQNVSVKVASLGQAIMQATRPKALMAPLQIGTGIQLHHNFGSKFLISFLHGLGYCSSYYDVQKFSRVASVVQGLNTELFVPGQFIQHVADNVDHNTCTLDGNISFHGIGIIAASTPALQAKRIPIPRRTVTNEEITTASRIDIKFYHQKESSGLAKMNFEELINIYHVPDPAASFNILWKSSLLLQCPRPGWNGLMQLVHKGRHPGKASVLFLPMIDLNPSDMSCIYSTLHFVAAQAEKYHFHAFSSQFLSAYESFALH